MKCFFTNIGYRNSSQNYFPDILPWALGPVYRITSQFMARCDNREDHQISQTRRAATHDAPWSFLFST